MRRSGGSAASRQSSVPSGRPDLGGGHFVYRGAVFQDLPPVEALAFQECDFPEVVVLGIDMVDLQHVDARGFQVRLQY